MEIEPGIYTERVHIQKAKGPLTLRGLAPPEGVVLIHACPGGAGSGKPGCSPCRPFNKSAGPTPGMRGDVTTMLALSEDFTAVNMTIANNACGYNAKEAHQSDALQAIADRQLFSNCRILGGQDTLLTGPGATRQYFHRSYINGSCDSIYGGSSAVFDDCTITVTDHVTAQKPPAGSGAAYLIVNSSLRQPGKGDFTFPARKGGAELGRPWGDYAHMIYKHVWMDEHIASYGWGDWSHECAAGAKLGCGLQHQPKVLVPERDSSGPGGNAAKRVRWSVQLTAAEAAKATPEAVLRGWVPVLRPPPTPTPAPTPKPPAPAPRPPGGGCDVDACFARCVAKYGGTVVADKAYDVRVREGVCRYERRQGQQQGQVLQGGAGRSVSRMRGVGEALQLRPEEAGRGRGRLRVCVLGAVCSVQ